MKKKEGRDRDKRENRKGVNVRKEEKRGRREGKPEKKGNEKRLRRRN